MSYAGSIVIDISGLDDVDSALAASLREVHGNPEEVRTAVKGHTKIAVAKAVRLMLLENPGKSWLGRDIAEALPDYPSVLRAVVSHIRQRAIICMPEDVKWADRQF